MFYQLVLPLNWITASGHEVGRGIASQYRPWRKSRLVPNARYAGRWNTKPTPDDLVCAHRTLPFGTYLRLRWRDRVGVCVVLDRGPYGFCKKLKTTHRPSRQCPAGFRYIITIRGRQLRGFYRGLIDATPAVHRMLGSAGWVRVRIERLNLERNRRVLRVRRGGES